MKADLVESIGKTKKWLNLSFIFNDKIVKSIQLTGTNIWQELKEFIVSHPDLLSKVKTLMVCNKYHDLQYISYFKNIESLHLRGTPKLEFPDLSQMNSLHFISVNSYSKETELKNLSTIPNLEKLWIGDFTIGSAIKINSFDEIIACSNLKILVLGNIKISENELRRIIDLDQLEELHVPQRVETKTLAFLTANLKNVKSDQLKAWHKVDYAFGDIKINGKRKPYLNSQEDQEKIKKYEEAFDKLLKQFSI